MTVTVAQMTQGELSKRQQILIGEVANYGLRYANASWGIIQSGSGAPVAWA
jgi:hypothetical protein